MVTFSGHSLLITLQSQETLPGEEKNPHITSGKL